MGKLKTLTAFLVGIVLVTVGFALNTFSATTPPQASDGYYELDRQLRKFSVVTAVY